MVRERPGAWKASLRLPDDLHDKLRRRAAAEGCSMNALMLRMIERRVREVELAPGRVKRRR